MTPLQQLNTLTNPAGLTPFGPIAVRRDRKGEWHAMNRIDRGFSSFARYSGRVEAVLGRLNVRVAAVKSDEHSTYLLCEPGK